MVQRKGKLEVVLLVLPLLVLVLYEPVLVRTTPLPSWVVPDDSPKAWNSCPAAIRSLYTGYDLHRLAEGTGPAVGVQRASTILNRVLTRYYRFFPIYHDIFNHPTLVEARFPDGQRREAWVQFDLMETYNFPERDGPQPNEGKLTAAFVDAASGEPLMLVTGIPVAWPCETGCCFKANVFASQGQMRGLLGVGVLYSILWARLWGRRKERTQRKAEQTGPDGIGDAGKKAGINYR